MIIGFVGTPGSGKSYESVKKILDNIRLGRKIYTNIDGLDQPSCREAIKQYCNITDFQLETCLNHLDRSQALEFWNHCQSGSLILIDEVHKLFSNRDWSSDKNKLFCDWASTHRHEGFDVVLITQDIEKIDKHARSLIEWTYLFRKVNFIGDMVKKKYISYAYSGDDHNGKPLSKNVRTYDDAVFRCYKSYTGQDVQELGFMQHVNVLKHPVFYAIPVVLAVLLYVGSKSSIASGDLFGSEQITANAQKLTTTKSDPTKSDHPSTFATFDRVPLDPVPLNSRASGPEQLPETKPQKIFIYDLPNGSIYAASTDSNVPPGATLRRTLAAI